MLNYSRFYMGRRRLLSDNISIRSSDLLYKLFEIFSNNANEEVFVYNTFAEQTLTITYDCNGVFQNSLVNVIFFFLPKRTNYN